MTHPRIVVLRRDIHGMPVTAYADAIRERLPDHDVRVARSPRQEREFIADAEIATGLSLDDALLERADDLRLFQCLYAGTDHLPVDAMLDRGIAITSASGVHAPNVSEWVVGMLIALTRRFQAGWRLQERREWRHFQAHSDLYGSTATVVGLGAIGRAVAERLHAFAVDTIGVRYTPSKGGPTDRVIGFDRDDFLDVLPETDHLILACPLTETTRGLVDAAALETLPPTAFLVNIARGPVVDTPALMEELRLEGIKGAALDVTDPEPLPEDHPLWGFENVLITPHNAGHTPQYYERVADILAANVRRAEASGTYDDLENQVDTTLT